MAQLTLTLRRDARTGRMILSVGVRSDEDALPHEHESLHQQLASVVLPGAGWERERPQREAVVG